MSHLDRMFFDIPGYAGVDVESKRMENRRIIHEYLDNPTFDPNVYDSQNRTPLYLAVERSRDDVIDKLLKHPEITPKNFYTLYETPTQVLEAIQHNFQVELNTNLYKQSVASLL